MLKILLSQLGSIFVLPVFAMKKMLLIGLFCTSLLSKTTAQQILSAAFYDDDFKVLLRQATKHNKPVLLFFTANWCQPCQQLKATSFSNETVASVMSLKYMAKMVDVEQFIGMDIADLYQVRQYPTILLLNKEGKEILRLKGYYPPSYLLKVLLDHQPK